MSRRGKLEPKRRGPKPPVALLHVVTDMEQAMAPRRDRLAPFDDHNCWRCRSGQLACVEGNPRRCSFLHARND